MREQVGVKSSTCGSVTKQSATKRLHARSSMRSFAAATLELLQQPFDIFEFFLRAGGFTGTAAKLVENLARPGQVRLIGNLDGATGHRSGLIQRPAERVGTLALLIIAIARLLPIRRHDVLGELLGAVAQLI